MPSFQRQSPPLPKATPTALNGSAGSILSTAVPVTSVKELYIKLCLYGKNRSGKTTLACQFPKPLLLVSCEPSETGGAMSVSKMEGVSLIRISHKQIGDEKVWGTKKAMMLAEELHGNNPFKTIVIDTATSYQDMILQELMGLSAIPEMLSWGMVTEDQYRDRSSKTREALRPFLDLPCHVVVTAQEKDHNPPKDRGTSKLMRGMQFESHFAADLGGATVKWLQDSCGYIAQLYQDKEVKTVTTKVKVGNTLRDDVTETETGRVVRRLRTMYHLNYSAGFRSATPGVVPQYIEATTPEEMYAEMLKVIKGEKTAKGKY